MMSQEKFLITGGGKRLGLYYTQNLAKCGHHVLSHYFSSPVVAQENVSFIQADLTQEKELNDLLKTMLDFKPSVLINNAAIFEYDNFKNFNQETFLKHNLINYFVPLQLCKAFYDMHLQNKTKGCIINVVDQKVLNPNMDYFTYTLSKINLYQASLLMAKEMAPVCRLNILAPGLTLPIEGQTDEEFKTQQNQLPLTDKTKAEHLLQTIEYFVKCKTISGQVIAVDSGEHFLSKSIYTTKI